MKILHLISSGGFFGAEQVLLNLASDPAVTSHVGALHNFHNPHLEVINEAERLGLQTAIFNCAGRFDFRVIPELHRFIEENNIDIIHTHNYKADILGFIISKFLRIKWIVTNHVWHGTDLKLRFYEKLDAFLLRYAHSVVAVSREIRDDLIHKGIKGDRVCIIENGVDFSRFGRATQAKEIKASLGILEGDKVVSIIGRLSKEKGHEVFINAAAQVVRQINNVKFLIVGDGPLMSGLKDKIAALNLNDKVIFTGIRQDMPLIYSISDILVNSSLIEGLPMTILEAMATKVPVIASAVGGIPQIINDGNIGLLIPPGNSNLLAENIKLLMDQPQLRERMVQAAYEKVKSDYSVERMRERYLKVYEETEKKRNL